MVKRDIHNFERKFELILDKIQQSNLSNANKTFLFQFKDDCLIENITKASIHRSLIMLKQMAELLDKDFSDYNETDIKQILAFLNSKKYSFWTLYTYKAVLKKFFKWMNKGECPSILKCVKNNRKRDSLTLPNEGEILTENFAKLTK